MHHYVLQYMKNLVSSTFSNQYTPSCPHKDLLLFNSFWFVTYECLLPAFRRPQCELSMVQSKVSMRSCHVGSRREQIRTGTNCTWPKLPRCISQKESANVHGSNYRVSQVRCAMRKASVAQTSVPFCLATNLRGAAGLTFVQHMKQMCSDLSYVWVQVCSVAIRQQCDSVAKCD
jgi:hypothetical protein